MRTIKLYGHLGKTFGKVHRMDVASPAEAIRALCSQFQGFKRQILMHNEPGYRVFIGKGNDISEQELHLQSSQDKDIKIVPVIAGAGGNSGFMSILIGAVLIAAAFVTAGASMSGFSAMMAAKGLGAAVVKMGVAMMLSGVMSLFMQPPKATRNEKKDQSSYLFNGATNSTAEGVPVPLVYGTHLVGSVVVSQEIETLDAALKV